jgi:hypothetical protein
VTSARIVSDAFFFDFSHATCDGVRNTATRSVFFSFAAAIAYLAADIVHPVILSRRSDRGGAVVA